MEHLRSLRHQQSLSVGKQLALTVAQPQFWHHVFAGLIGLILGIVSLISPWLGLLLVIGTAVIIALLSKPVLITYLLVSAIVLTSGMQRGHPIPFLIPNEVVLLLSVLVAIPFVVLKRWQRITLPRHALLAIIILVGGTVVIPYVTYLLRAIPLDIADHLKLLAPVQYILIFWLFRNLPNSDAVRVRLIRWMLFWASIVAVIALLQTFRVGPVTALLSTWYRSAHEAVAGPGRATSVLGAWNGLGTFMMLNLVLGRTLLYSQGEELSGRVFLLITMGLCAMGLLVSGSYAGLLGTALGFLIIGRIERRMRASLLLLLAIVILILPLLPYITQRFEYQFRSGGLLPQTLVFRFKVWREVFWPIVREHWLFGFRPVLPANVSWQYAESQYLTLLVQSGIASLFAHLAWIGLMLLWLRRKLHSRHELSAVLARSTFTTLIVLTMMGLTNAVFTYSGVIEYVWIFLGLIGSVEEVSA